MSGMISDQVQDGYQRVQDLHSLCHAVLDTASHLYSQKVEIAEQVRNDIKVRDSVQELISWSNVKRYFVLS